jgi:hypothetical protein
MSFPGVLLNDPLYAAVFATMSRTLVPSLWCLLACWPLLQVRCVITFAAFCLTERLLECCGYRGFV